MEPNLNTIHSDTEKSQNEIYDINATLDHIAHWLPAQGPVKDFIHHNTLHAYQHHSFHDGVRIASDMYGTQRYLPFEEYQDLYRTGHISEWSIRRVLAAHFTSRESADRALSQMLKISHKQERRSILSQGLRSRWQSKYSLDIGQKAHPLLFRLVSQYLDQGITNWRMPHSSDGFLACIRRITAESFLPFPPFSHPAARDLLQMEPAEIIHTILKSFVSDEKHFMRYLAELCLAHPGWSGLVRVIEKQPESLIQRKRISLLEFCAIELIIEYVHVYERFEGAIPLVATHDEAELKIPADLPPREATSIEMMHQLWHEAYERTYVDQLLISLEQNTKKSPPTNDISVQAYFCIDDRECSLRRHLEETDPSVRTYGSAGFFGVDCVFQGIDDAFPFKHCPVPVSPKHLIRELPNASKSEPKKSTVSAYFTRLFNPNRSEDSTFSRGFLISQALGFWSAFRLFVDILKPQLTPPSASSLRRVNTESKLQITHEGEKSLQHNYVIGYNPIEMADRVEDLLRGTGIAKSPLADVVVFFGHGASSVNNPYFSAYDCGACSGKAGAPNARAFAAMANLTEVRKILSDRGLTISPTTWFIGALHDTTRDEVQFFDIDEAPAYAKVKLDKFKLTLNISLLKNAKERCEKFELVPTDLSQAEALHEVRHRSVAIFEPRPELNHATNAACIVGRRDLTRGMNLQRRAFLNSYDPAVDPSGAILTQILSAVVPVCGGINLEYFFSRVDSNIYGAGSKLPHNVASLVGVTNGIDSDLLTGLPTQMTELHPPIRLSIVVEQEPEVALQAAKKNPGIYEWITNGWVRYFAYSPTSGKTSEFIKGRMAPGDFAAYPSTLSSGGM